MGKVLLYFLLICGEISAEENNIPTFTNLLDKYEKALILLEKYKDENRQLKNEIASYGNASNIKNKEYESDKDIYLENSVDTLKKNIYVVTHDYQNLRESPSPQSLIVNVLKKGTNVKILEVIKVNGDKYWLKVNYTNSYSESIVGYIYYQK